MSALILTYDDVMERLSHLELSGHKVWGIPRGGSVAASLAANYGAIVVGDPRHADIILDDVRDSGATGDHWQSHRPDAQMLYVVDKQVEGVTDWVQFPWEPSAQQDAEDTVRRLIEHIGENPSRLGLEGTPERVVRSWQELFAGYTEQPKLTWFEDDTDEMIISQGITFYSTCEHHLLPFFGVAHVGYIPDGKVIGISKLSRIVEHYARRLQIQERLARQIGEAIAEDVKGVAVHLEGQHMCMMARGAKQHNSTMITNYLTGVFRTKSEARNEFLQEIS
jgi:GTP cyclohydrolase I